MDFGLVRFLRLRRTKARAVHIELEHHEVQLNHQQGANRVLIPVVKTILEAPEFIEKGRKLVNRLRPPGFEKKLRKNVRSLGDEQLRVSCGQLIRIAIDGHALLVRGNRLKFQLQPPGGVTKTLGPGWREIEKLGVVAEDHFELRPEDKEDLRVRLSGRRFGEFLDWYKTGKGRETLPNREFVEELVETGILPGELFANLQFEHDRTYATDLRFVEYFGCNEVLIHEVFRPVLSAEQETHLRDMLVSQKVALDSSFAWVPFSAIRSRGSISGAGSQDLAIAPHCLWMLDPNTVEELR